MFPAHRSLKRLRDGLRLEAEVQETGPGDLDLLAPPAHIELRQHVGGELARVQLARLGQRHERVRLVIAELRIRTGADEQGRRARVGQDGNDGRVKLLFEELVEQENGGS